MQSKRPSTNPSELQIALDNRAFEIQMFWQRSNYFLVLMTALGIGVFTIKSDFYALLISIFATITSWYWYQTNLGSKFWHESWEVEVITLAKELGIRSFERPTVDVIDQVRLSFEDAYLSGDKGRARRWIDRQVLKKPSVSHYMILLSLTSMALWALVSICYGYDLGRSVWYSPPKLSPKGSTEKPMKERAQSPDAVEFAPSRREDVPARPATRQQSGSSGNISVSDRATDSKLASDQLRAGASRGNGINSGIEPSASLPACSNNEASGNQT